MNAGTSKVTVGSSDGNEIVNSEKWPCGVCGIGVQTISVKCTTCGFTSGVVAEVVTCR